MYVRLFPLCALSLGLSLHLPAQTMTSMPGMEGEHHHHEETAPDHYGTVHFPVSCNAAAQSAITLGVAQIHSFGYETAGRTFARAVTTDPDCAMAHWGVAMAHFHEIWGNPDPAAFKIGIDEIHAAQALAGKHPVTPLETGYIAALAAYYAGDSKAFQPRLDAYSAAMAALHGAFPANVEVAAFYALSLLADVAPDDTSLRKERHALAILVPLFKANPDHPGLAHYIIHTCDTPALAADGKEAAEAYAAIASSSPHALHMPGHIFARLGMWPEDIVSNEASVRASQQAEQAGVPGAAHQLHADEFLIYAYLQTGQDDKARVLTASIGSVGQKMAAMPGMDDMKMAGPYFDNELRSIFLLEMHDWKAAEALQPGPGSKPEESLNIAWAHGIAAGHLRDKKVAKAALKQVDAGIEKLRKTRGTAALTGAAVPRTEVLGWLRFAQGKPSEAIAALRQAADQQDKLGQNEVDIPAREMLADMLLELNRPADALAEYKQSLVLSPNRLNGLIGAGRAAEALGRTDEAASYFAAVAHNTDRGSHSQRRDVQQAVAFAEQHPAAKPA